MNYLELCQVVKRELGLSGDGPSAVTNQQGQLAQLVGFVQAADLLVQNLWVDWKFLWSEYSFSTIASLEKYSPPSDLGVWDRNSFYIEDTLGSIEMEFSDDYNRYRNPEKEEGLPSVIIQQPNNILKLYPIPDDAYMVYSEYFKSPVPMVENTDVSLIPSQFHRIIISRAKMLYAEAEELPQQLQIYAVEYNETLVKLEAYSLIGQHRNSFAQPEQMVVRAL